VGATGGCSSEDGRDHQALRRASQASSSGTSGANRTAVTCECER
jgi:hypothetical protein